MRLVYLIILIVISITTVQAKTIVFLGDSLTAGHNIPQNKAFPALINEKITSESVIIINAGVSGDTTFNLLNRLHWVIEQTKPDIAFLCIGANDGLRGFSTNAIQSNLQQIINILSSQNITTVLAGISLPENYAPLYVTSFESVFETIAQKNKLVFFPFLLKDVAGRNEFNLSDRIHPNIKGHEIIANNVFEFLVSNNIILHPNTVH